MGKKEIEILGSGSGQELVVPPLLIEKLKRLPQSPGVYLHKDEAGRGLYVGKAQKLKNRVRSYFQSSANHCARIRWMVSRVYDVEFFLVDSDLEALILECNLIKKYRPYFNVKYRDDKRYPLLEITSSETFPKIRVVRRARHAKNRYFGPYPDTGAMRRTLKLIQKIFQIRTCKIDMSKTSERPCLDYHIELCTAPCTRYVDEETYGAQVKAAIDFLEGRSEKLLRRLRGEMEYHAKELDFERCARLRDTLRDVESVIEKQRVVLGSEKEEEDYIGLSSRRDTVSVHVYCVRQGKLLSQKSFFLDSHGGAKEAEQMSAFVKEHYDNPVTLPRRLLLSVMPEDRDVLEDWLSAKAGVRVEIRCPQRGEKRKLLELCLKSSRQNLEMESVTPSRHEARRQGLKELQEALGLKDPPWRIECVDISNTQGKEAVGSLVVFEQGLPKKDQYRKFRIRSGDTPDDFRMMHEVLTRRFADRGTKEQYESLPDLLVVDGGKGQLSSACRALDEMSMSGRVPVVGLAKQHEWIFSPGEKDPLILEPGSKGLSLMTHLRDEAHRFAIRFHRKLRKKASKKSPLDEIRGVGPVKKKLLLAHFGSLKRLMAASPEELSEVKGFGERTARELHAALHR